MTAEQWTEAFEKAAPLGMMLEDAAEAILASIVENATAKDIAEFRQGHSLHLANALEAAKECLGIEGEENLLLEFPDADEGPSSRDGTARGVPDRRLTTRSAAPRHLSVVANLR